MLICITGGSGSGKTTLLKRLNDELEERGWKDKINIIQHYATRKRRHEDEWGFQSINKPVPSTFIETERGDALQVPWSSHQGDNLYHREDMIAYFNSYDSNTHYFALDEQVIRGKINLYVVDAQSALQVYDFYEDSEEIEVRTVYIQVDEIERVIRLVKRELLNTNKVADIITEEKAEFIATTNILREQWLDTDKNQEIVDSRVHRDRELYNLVKCDYTIDGNKSLDCVYDTFLDSIKKLGGV